MEDSVNNGGDIFSSIAQQRSEHRMDLLMRPEPLELPEIELPCGTHDPTASFHAAAKMSTKIELLEELSIYKEKYRVFMENCAPELLPVRHSFKVTNFDWRQETAADESDFSSTLNGAGEWEQVKIPHFGPPQGKQVTYYRTKFTLNDKDFAAGALFVRLKGVDYKAHVFINNSYMGSHTGFFAPFEFEFTGQSRLGENVLLIKVENDFTVMGNSEEGVGPSQIGDKIYGATGPGYDDPELGWHHGPAGMGIFQDVIIESRPRIFISDLFVRPNLENSSAEAWIEITNCDSIPAEVKLKLSVFGQNFNETVLKDLAYTPGIDKEFGFGDNLEIAKHLAAGRALDERLPLLMESGRNFLRVPLDMDGCRCWTPDEPWLYQLQVQLESESEVKTDAVSSQFGMRSFEIVENQDATGLRNRLKFNGSPIRLRGANTMGHLQRCVMEENWDQLRDDILLAKICNMNFLRMTQRPVQSEVYDYCDRLGLMLQVDLPLFGGMRRGLFSEGVKQAEEMERLIRSHPSCILISYVNEPFPNGNNKPQRLMDRGELEQFMKACDIAVHMQNPDRAIKPVDGDYDPPAPGLSDKHCYAGWYNGHGLEMGELHKGYWQYCAKGTYIGCGEFGAEGLDSRSVMKQYYPFWLPKNSDDERAWSPNRIAQTQAGKFHYMFYDTPHSVDEWIQSSWDYQAWSTRMMTEAFRRDYRMVTYAIHLFIAAWPCGWMKTIMDVDRNPKDAYFVYRDLNSPTIVSLRTDRFTYWSDEDAVIEAWVCNDVDSMDNMELRYQIVIDDKVIFSQSAPASVAQCTSEFQGFIRFRLPEVSSRTSISVQLALVDCDGRINHHTEQILTVFPKVDLPNVITYCSGEIGGTVASLSEQAGEGVTSDIAKADLIILDDFADYQQQRKSIDARVRNGATLLFLDLAPGAHKVDGCDVHIKLCSMNSVNFLSRATGHPWVSGFMGNDFSMWYDEKRGLISPILDSTFEAEDFTPVLLSGNLNSSNEWSPAYALAEKKSGRGRIIISQLKLNGRLKSNPVAKMMIEKIVGNT
jgi:hypothetical protein